VPAERTWLAPLDSNWHDVAAEAQQLADHRSAPPEAASASVVRLQASLEKVQLETQQLAAAAQDAMSHELNESELSAQRAERLSWIAAVGALLLSILLSAMLARSIVLPLERLTEGTREVSAGRFDYRLEMFGTDEFAQVSQDFNSMTERLDELDRMKRDFVSKVSHDLKTPLSSMQETISALLDELPGPLTPKQRQLLELNRDRRTAAVGDAEQTARSVPYRGGLGAGLSDGGRRPARSSFGRADECGAPAAGSAHVDHGTRAPLAGTRRFSRACSGVRQLARERNKILT
jgi:signal transduction histidine kinase